MAKIGPNERCPCGSGKKFKKCCRDLLVATTYTAAERTSALDRLHAWVDRFADDEWEEAMDEFWGRFGDAAAELPDDLTLQSDDVEETWFAFDRGGDRGAPVVDTFLSEAELGVGERAFLSALRRSTMRLYEVVDAVAGVSLTLRDAIEGDVVTVNERLGSRSIGLHEHIAARVVPWDRREAPRWSAGCSTSPCSSRTL